MTTKINYIQSITDPRGMMNSSWLERHGVSRAEQGMYVKSGWLERVATGIYKFANTTPTVFGALSACEEQEGVTYRIAASSALELHGFAHYIPMGTPPLHIATPLKHPLPRWMHEYSWQNDIHEFSTKVFGENPETTQVDVEGLRLKVSTPELAIMEALLFVPTFYNYMDVFHYMESLTTLRPEHLSDLLCKCSSVKVKRLFLYMAEKANHKWFAHLNLDGVNLGSGPRSLAKGGVKIPKYNIIIPRELANYE